MLLLIKPTRLFQPALVLQRASHVSDSLLTSPYLVPSVVMAISPSAPALDNGELIRDLRSKFLGYLDCMSSSPSVTKLKTRCADDSTRVPWPLVVVEEKREPDGSTRRVMHFHNTFYDLLEIISHLHRPPQQDEHHKRYYVFYMNTFFFESEVRGWFEPLKVWHPHHWAKEFLPDQGSAVNWFHSVNINLTRRAAARHVQRVVNNYMGIDPASTSTPVRWASEEARATERARAATQSFPSQEELIAAIQTRETKSIQHKTTLAEQELEIPPAKRPRHLMQH